MLKEIVPAKSKRCLDVVRIEQDIYYAVWQLETRGLIKRTPRHRGYTAMSDFKKRQFWLWGCHDTEILAGREAN
jgi:hypothetical protein